MFKYNYEYNLQLDNQPPDFYKQIIFYRQRSRQKQIGSLGLHVAYCACSYLE